METNDFMDWLNREQEYVEKELHLIGLNNILCDNEIEMI